MDSKNPHDVRICVKFAAVVLKKQRLPIPTQRVSAILNDAALLSGQQLPPRTVEPMLELMKQLGVITCDKRPTGTNRKLNKMHVIAVNDIVDELDDSCFKSVDLGKLRRDMGARWRTSTTGSSVSPLETKQEIQRLDSEISKATKLVDQKRAEVQLITQRIRMGLHGPRDESVVSGVLRGELADAKAQLKSLQRTKFRLEKSLPQSNAGLEVVS